MQHRGGNLANEDPLHMLHGLIATDVDYVLADDFEISLPDARVSVVEIESYNENEAQDENADWLSPPRRR